MAPVPVDGTYSDGEEIRIGDEGPAIIALLTPGHTSGGTSWHWQSCEGDACLAIAFVDSLSAVARDGYRFSDHPARVAPFSATFQRVAGMPCDILITPHPSASNLFARFAGAAPLRNPAACRELAATMAARLDARLAQEAAR